MIKLPQYVLAVLKTRALLVLALGVFCFTPIAAAAPPSAKNTPTVKTGNTKAPSAKVSLTKAKPISAPSAGHTPLHSKGPQSTTPATTQNAGHTKVPQGTTHTKTPQGNTNAHGPQGNTNTKAPQGNTNTKVPQGNTHTKVPQNATNTHGPQGNTHTKVPQNVTNTHG